MSALLCLSLTVLAWTATMLHVSYSNVYTSSKKIEDMVLREEQILNDLQTAVQELGNETLLSYFSKFYHDRLPKARERRLDPHVLGNLSHPNGVYSCIKQFATEYENIRSTLNFTQTPSIQKHLDSIAAQEDVIGARQSFIRLQEVYNLNTSDMIKGNYFGFFGPELSEADILDIGEAAFNDNQFDYAISWLQEALKLSTSQPTAEFQDFGASTTSKGRILALLGLSYLRKGNKVKADELWQEARRASEPELRRGVIAAIVDKPWYITMMENKTQCPQGYVDTSAAEQSRALIYPEIRRVKGTAEPDSHVSLLERELNIDQIFSGPVETDEDLKRLCTLQNKLTLKKFDPRISCSYKEVILPYNRFKQELVSITPYVALLYEVVTDKEIDMIMQVAGHKLSRGVIKLNGIDVVNRHRTSDVSFLFDDESPDVLGPLSKKVAGITNLNTANFEPGYSLQAEPFQVVNYGMGGHYDLHCDFFNYSTLNSPTFQYGGDRLATFLMYLTDVERGGSTVFNIVDLAVKPVKKMALFWYNYKPSGELDLDTSHAGCPVVIGHKWVSNKWMWNYGNMFTRRCGLTPDATQLDIEPYMKTGWI